MAKYVCSVCGYVYEGDAAPEFCPLCKAPASKFNLVEAEAAYATVHIIGEGGKDKVEPDVYQDLVNNFNGECSEVGMYLAMARAADREGYPEIAAAFTKYAFEEAEHAAKFAELLGEVVSPSTKMPRQALAPVSSSWLREQRLLIMTLFMIRCMKWQKMRQDTAPDLQVCLKDILAINIFTYCCKR